MGNFFGGYLASGIRSGMVVLILLPLAYVYKQFEPIHWRRNWRYMVGTFIASLFVWGPLYYAILHAGVGISLAVNYASIVIGMFLLGWLLNKERFTGDKLLATILGFIGLAFVFSPGTGHVNLMPLLAAMLSGFAASANMVIAKKLPYNATQSTWIFWVLSALANICMAVILQEKIPVIGWHMEWLYLFIFAVASVAASWLFIKGLKLIEAGAAGILGLLEIVFGVLFGIELFHERLSFLVCIGISIIILATVIPYVKDYNAKKGALDS